MRRGAVPPGGVVHAVLEPRRRRDAFLADHVHLLEGDLDLPRLRRRGPLGHRQVGRPPASADRRGPAAAAGRRG